MLAGEFVEAGTASPSTLLVLHGLGDTHEGWSWLPQALGLPWLNYLLLDAPDPYGDGLSWYDIYGDSAPGIRRSREAIHEVLRRCIGAGRSSADLALLGFSQGCLMSLDAGLRFRPPLRAIVGISGYVWEPEALLRECLPAAERPPVLLTHGRQDPLIPIDRVRSQVAVLQRGGLAPEWREFDKAHSVAGEPEFEVIRGFLAKAFGRAR